MSRGETEPNWGYHFTLLRRALPAGVVYQMLIVVTPKSPRQNAPDREKPWRPL